jgi:hypothetical protein
MPPLRIFKFKHKFSVRISPIIVSIYGNINEAWDILSNHVISIDDWKLISN